ncbi:MAG: bifunctional methylenetetrahydrofolate dehydrogenase/methenyltetrahydrofolate cyclohydrolase FolD [Chitinivibrionales bacterium]|nr:bifunctional methylenetetrahydrofolate dehydrogenase/methenyltetrahydrofolate cyclohydrolase FolD [Chitinivibrionales bacterium]
MPAEIIDGKQIAREIREELKREVERLKAQGVTPGLGVVLVGDDPASQSYVSSKEKACEQLGMYSDDNRLPPETTQEELLELVDKMNIDPNIHGILVQLPLPGHIDEKIVINAISPDKDVDGFHPVTIGRMVIGDTCFLSCTPHGIWQLLIRSGVEMSGAHVVVVGRSNIVGKPIANMLYQKKEHANATVTICHTRTKDIAYHTRQADIVIAAAGRPDTITADMIKQGATIIDVGINRIDDPTRKRGYRLVGDVDFEGCSRKAGLITPVPGGVGPMTITMLLYNTIESAKATLQS